MMVFTLVPAMAPLIGAQIIALADWRGIFLAFVLFSVLSIGWYMARLGETLPPVVLLLLGAASYHLRPAERRISS